MCARATCGPYLSQKCSFISSFLWLPVLPAAAN
jgi:hypothetical protein